MLFYNVLVLKVYCILLCSKNHFFFNILLKNYYSYICFFEMLFESLFEIVIQIITKIVTRIITRKSVGIHYSIRITKYFWLFDSIPEAIFFPLLDLIRVTIS